MSASVLTPPRPGRHARGARTGPRDSWAAGESPAAPSRWPTTSSASSRRSSSPRAERVTTVTTPSLGGSSRRSSRPPTARSAREHGVARPGDADAGLVRAAQAPRQAFGGVLRDDAAVVDDHDPLARHAHLGQDVRAEEHRRRAGEGADEGADLDDLPRVEPDGRLVEDEHARPMHEGLRDADALAVALRELADQLAGDLGEAAGVRSPRRAARAGSPPGRPSPRRRSVRKRRPSDPDRGRRSRAGSRCARGPRAGCSLDVEAVDADPALARRKEARQDAHDRRLARAVRPEQTHDLAGGDVKLTPATARVRAELLHQSLDGDHGRRASA